MAKLPCCAIHGVGVRAIHSQCSTRRSRQTMKQVSHITQVHLRQGRLQNCNVWHTHGKSLLLLHSTPSWTTITVFLLVSILQFKWLPRIVYSLLLDMSTGEQMRYKFGMVLCPYVQSLVFTAAYAAPGTLRADSSGSQYAAN